MNPDLTPSWDIWRDDYGRLAYRGSARGRDEEEAALNHAKQFPEFHKNVSWLYVTRSGSYFKGMGFRRVRVERRVTVERPPPIKREEWSVSSVS